MTAPDKGYVGCGTEHMIYRVFANRVYTVSGNVDARSLNRAELTPEQQLSQTIDTYEKFKGVQIRTYERKDDEEIHTGVIGQELREIFPDTILEETVTIEGGEPETTLFLDETALLYKTIIVAQGLQKEAETLRQKADEQEEDSAALHGKLEAMTRQMEKMSRQLDRSLR